MRLKKILSCILVFVILTANFTIAEASTASQSALYASAAERLKTLGILDGAEFSAEMPQGIITRGEFTKAMVVAYGFEDDAMAMAGQTVFSDIVNGSEISGFINIAANKNIITGMSDGKFHPEGNVNFAQFCTVMVRALGYTDEDLQGTWPKNYVLQAKLLGLTNGINLSNSSGVPKWAAAVMIDRLLDTIIKSDGDSEQTFAENSGITGDSYQYAKISNPVYSKPEIVAGFSPEDKNIGSIDLSGSLMIIKNGQFIDASEIEENDVVYQVSDVWETKRYILVVDDKVQGKITSLSPTSVGIDGTIYQFKSVNNSIGMYKVDDYATLLLGYDGKVVDFLDLGRQNNGDFAFVVNYSSDSEGYKVKLLMTDGTLREYHVDSYPINSKGKLVRFENIDGDTVSLKGVSYNNSEDVNIQKDARLINGNQAASNIKIFNLISDIDDIDDLEDEEDVSVELIDWSDLPSGTVDSDKVLCINKDGEFGDVNVMLVDDILGEGYKTGIVTGITKTKVTDEETGEEDEDVSYTILVEGKEYTWDTNIKASKGDLVKVRIVDDEIDTKPVIRKAESSASKIESFDYNRIKINGSTYSISDSVVIYYKDKLGNYTQKEVLDIDADGKYDKVSIYLDMPVSDGGKVDAIFVDE